MTQTYKQGEFCWFELATTDPAAATAFYTGLFGWTIREAPLPDGMTYYTFQKDGKSVAACAQQQPQEREMGVPPHWNTYIAADNIDELVPKAEELGAKVIAPPFDVMELGRMAVVTDPTGAVISFWQDASMSGAELINQSGTGIRVWNELTTPDMDGATAFYTGLFGYTAETRDMPNGPYTTLSLGDTQWAGIMNPPPDSGIPPVWGLYLGVEDTDAIVAKATELGGQQVFETMEIPEVGRFAWITDPTGATFGILQPTS